MRTWTWTQIHVKAEPGGRCTFTHWWYESWPGGVFMSDHWWYKNLGMTEYLHPPIGGVLWKSGCDGLCTSTHRLYEILSVVEWVHLLTDGVKSWGYYHVAVYSQLEQVRQRQSRSWKLPWQNPWHVGSSPRCQVQGDSPSQTKTGSQKNSKVFFVHPCTHLHIQKCTHIHRSIPFTCK